MTAIFIWTRVVSNANGPMRSLLLSQGVWPGIKTLPTGCPWHRSKGSCLSGTFGAYNNALHSKHHYSGAKIGAGLVTLPEPPLTRLVHMKYLAIVLVSRSHFIGHVLLQYSDCHLSSHFMLARIVSLCPNTRGIKQQSDTWTFTSTWLQYHILAAPFIHDPNLSSHLKS